MTTTAMMTEHIDTRDGWREASHAEAIRAPEHIGYQDAEHQWHYWVRVPPVPPLPTATWSVVLVTFRDAVDKRAYVRNEVGGWSPVPDGMGYPPELMPERISGFEVLAEPRAETVKAIVSWLRVEIVADAIADAMACEFGVNHD